MRFDLSDEEWSVREPLMPNSRKSAGSVQSLSHFWFRLSGPEAGSGGDGTSHLLVLQQLDVQISLGRPSGAGDVPEPGGSEVERRLPIRECAHHARTPPDLAQDALERIVIPCTTVQFRAWPPKKSIT